jgi:hypothetical protein
MVRDLMESVDQEQMNQGLAANVVLHLMASVVLHLMANVVQDPMDQDWAANVVLHLMANVVQDPMDQDPAANVDHHLMANVDQDPMDQDPMDHVQAANVVHLEAVHLVHHNRSALNEQTRNRSQAIGSTLLPMQSKKFLRNKPSGVNILVCRLSMW